MDTQSSPIFLKPQRLLVILCALAIVVSFFFLATTNNQEKEQTIHINAWKSINAPAPLPVFESQGIVVGKKMYIFGGYHTRNAQASADSYVFDSETNTWSKIADMPEPITHAGITVDGSTIYIAGGEIGSHPGPVTNHVWKYYIDKNSWEAVYPLPQERTAGALTIIGKTLHFFGGGIRNPEEQGITIDSAKHWTLDLEHPTGWYEKAPLPNPRNHLAGIVFNGNIYAIGGQHLENKLREFVSDVHMYDSRTNKWVEKAPLPFGMSHITSSTFILNGRIITVGGITAGEGPGGAELISSVLSYNPKTDYWEYLTSVPQPIQATVAGRIGNSIYMTTGKNTKDVLLSETVKATYSITRE